MRFVYVMDPMDRVLPDKDTTFAFMRAAQGRGHSALHCEPKDLIVKGGDVFAKVRHVTVSDAPPHVTFGKAETVRLADVEAVLIRKDPPFDAMYLYATLVLERARGRTVLMNDPRGLREGNEKLYALHFPQWMPKTMVSSHEDEIFAFVKQVGGRAVIKPLDLAGGSGVMLLNDGDKNAKSIVQLLTTDGTRYAMVQEFLPAVTSGDKRILLLDGQVLGAINRIPTAQDFRSNIHVGGSVEPVEVTPEERRMVADLAPRLKQDGLIFVGLDVIGGKLTEVNVTSPTGIQQLSQHENKDRAADVIAWVERNANDYRPAMKSIPAD
jgi:glutathione synthase